MNNKICNPKTEVDCGMKLNDKDYLNCVLSCLKELVKNYSVALTEASNEKLYHYYKQVFDKYSSLQREVYELMFKKGWYVIDEAEKEKVNEKHNILNQELSDLTK